MSDLIPDEILSVAPAVMTPVEHYREAERLIGLVDDGKAGDTMLTVADLLKMAQVHATLAAAMPVVHLNL